MKSLLKNYAFYVVIIILIVMFFVFPTSVSSSVATALRLCGNVVIPSLFPFFVLSTLFIESGLCTKIGRLISPAFTPLFRLSSPCCVTFILSLVSGYPAGGVGAVTLYRNNGCSKQECQRLLAFCNNCGPAFIITAIGSTMLNNYHLGITLYVVHIICAALTGIVFGRFYPKPQHVSIPPVSKAALPIMDLLIGSIKKSLFIMLDVCAIIVTFSALISLLSSSGIIGKLGQLLFSALNFPMDADMINATIVGLLELTNGANLISICNADPIVTLVILSALIGFGGLCVHIQLLSQIKDAGINTTHYFFGKLFHCLTSAVLMYLIAKFMYNTDAVFMPQTALASSPFLLFLTSVLLFLGFVVVMFAISFLCWKKAR